MVSSLCLAIHVAPCLHFWRFLSIRQNVLHAVNMKTVIAPSVASFVSFYALDSQVFDVKVVNRPPGEKPQ